MSATSSLRPRGIAGPVRARGRPGAGEPLGLQRERAAARPSCSPGHDPCLSHLLTSSTCIAEPRSGHETAALLSSRRTDTTEQDLLTATAGVHRKRMRASCCSPAALSQHWPCHRRRSGAASRIRTDRAVTSPSFRLVREIACRMAQSRGAQPTGARQLAGVDRLPADGNGLRPESSSFESCFLIRKNNLIADEVQQRGTVNHTSGLPARSPEARLDPQRRRADRGRIIIRPAIPSRRGKTSR